MLTTGGQLRAARAAAKLTREELAAAAGIGVTTVQRLEAEDRLRVTRVTVDSLAGALARHGVEFTEDGVRLATPGRRP